MSKAEVLLRVENLVHDYLLPRDSLLVPRRRLRAVDDVSFTLRRGESFGLVGESGCGKSTLARAVMALERPTSGRVHFAGEDLFGLSPAVLKHRRRGFQMVFQDPYGSLDPRQRVEAIVAEPLKSLRDSATRAGDWWSQVAEALQSVGLSVEDARRYPHEFSGGQRQRIAIARALITRPALIVADEPVSALDVSVQAQVLNLMMDLQEEFGLSYLFIGHDLGVMRQVTDRIAVMYLGRIVEEGATEVVFSDPRHPYTRALLAAVPRPQPGRAPTGRAATGSASTGSAASRSVASLPAPPDSGCAFAPRCPLAEAGCRQEAPRLRALPAAQAVACHLA